MGPRDNTRHLMLEGAREVGIVLVAVWPLVLVIGVMGAFFVFGAR